LTATDGGAVLSQTSALVTQAGYDRYGIRIAVIFQAISGVCALAGKLEPKFSQVPKLSLLVVDLPGD